MKIIYLTCLYFLIFAGSNFAYGLLCYQCFSGDKNHSMYHKNCGGFGAQLPNRYLVDCSSPSAWVRDSSRHKFLNKTELRELHEFGKSVNFACWKVRDLSDGDDVTLRSCVLGDSSKIDTCTSGEKKGDDKDNKLELKGSICQCYSDGCNGGGSRIMFPTITKVFLVVILASVFSIMVMDLLFTTV